MSTEKCTGRFQFWWNKVSDELSSLIRCLPGMWRFVQQHECLREEKRREWKRTSDWALWDTSVESVWSDCGSPDMTLLTGKKQTIGWRISIIIRRYRSNEGCRKAEDDRNWWQFGWFNCIKLLSNAHMSNFFRVYHPKTKMNFGDYSETVVNSLPSCHLAKGTKHSAVTDSLFNSFFPQAMRFHNTQREAIQVSSCWCLRYPEWVSSG